MEKKSSDSESDSEPSSSSAAAHHQEQHHHQQHHREEQPVVDKAKKRSLAQGMKEKFNMFRRKPDSHAQQQQQQASGSGPLVKPTPEVALNWSKSFDTLLADRYGLEMFRDYLRKEFSDENIEFWISCEEYKRLKSADRPPVAKSIFDNYVAIQAPHEVNLDSKTRVMTETNMSHVDGQTFEVAQKRIQALMEKDSYPRFLRTSDYQELLGSQRHKLHLS